MSFDVVALADADREAVTDYLQWYGLDRDFVQWKYYDEAFNQGRNRGFVAVQNDRPVGFIGLIPFRASNRGKFFDTAWTCDWSLHDSVTNRAISVSLLQKAVRSMPSVFHIGGNELTTRVFFRLAAFSDAEAVCDYVLPLRLSSVVGRLARKLPVLARLRNSAVSTLPIHRVRGARGTVDRTAGVNPKSLTFADACHPSLTFRPAYDFDYLDWLIARCPALESYSFLGKNGVSAIAWRSVAPGLEWRLAIQSPAEQGDELSRLLGQAIAFAYSNKGDCVRVRVTRRDTHLCRALEQSGFRFNRYQPFFAFHQSKEGNTTDDPTGLSYLDCDDSSIRLR